MELSNTLVHFKYLQWFIILWGALDSEIQAKRHIKLKPAANAWQPCLPIAKYVKYNFVDYYTEPSRTVPNFVLPVSIKH